MNPEHLNSTPARWYTLLGLLLVTACTSSPSSRPDAPPGPDLPAVADFAEGACAPVAADVIGVGAALYMARFAKQRRFVAVLRTALDTLASLPSIVYGLFGFLVFVEFTSGIIQGFYTPLLTDDVVAVCAAHNPLEHRTLEVHDLLTTPLALREAGSGTLAVLEAALADDAAPGWWWLSAFGAGFSCHGALLEVR